MEFEDLRAPVVCGDGVVARLPGLVVLATGPEDAVRRLLEICGEVAGARPGRPLARRLAAWLGGDGAPPDELAFGTVAATDRGVAVFLNGPVTVHVDGAASISGHDSAAWTDRLIPGALAPGARPCTLVLDGVTVPSGLYGGFHDLRAGTVPGVAVGLIPAGARAAAPAPALAPAVVAAPPVSKPPARPAAPAATEAAIPLLDKTPAPDPAPVPAPAEVPVPPVPEPAGAPAVLRAPRRSDALRDAGRPERREPLDAGQPLTVPSGARRPGPDPGAADPGAADPGAADPGAAAPRAPRPAAPVPDEPQASGHLCSRGHLNDPRSHFCVLCGIRMNERTGVLVVGPRPPLGLMVFDDGAVYTVDAEYLVGRMPDVDDRVRTGALRSIVVADDSGSVSRVHAEVRVSGWEVMLVDSGSRNGTFVAEPGEQAWSPVPPRESRTLVPGTRVRLGVRTFVFESPSGVR